MLRSLRSKLILASVLWTAGLLLLLHVTSILLLMHVFPPVRKGNATWAVVVAAGLMIAGVAALLGSLAPFRRLREKLVSLRVGEDRRIAGEYPSEVQPLIENLNALLEDRERAVRRAVATAGDLAHGLKTPLAVLAQEADRAEAEGQIELARGITQQVERMSRQVNYHLARARAAASGASNGARCPAGECVDALVRTLAKLYSERAVEISSSVGREICVRAQREDLDEMLGNLLDNACKWARSRIEITAARSGDAVVIAIDDDGPGLARDLRSAALERGVRMDQAAPGSGLGLAIVRDLAELYGGAIALEDSRLGGLSARVSLAIA